MELRKKIEKMNKFIVPTKNSLYILYAKKILEVLAEPAVGEVPRSESTLIPC